MTSHLVVSYTLVYYAFHPRALPVDSTLLVAHDPPLFIEFKIDPYQASIMDRTNRSLKKGDNT